MRSKTVAAIVWLALMALVLGGLLNIAVAWRIATKPAPYPYQAPIFVTAAKGPHWMYRRREAFGLVRLDATAAHAAPTTFTALEEKAAPSWSALARPPQSDRQQTQIVEEGFGWPLTALTCEWVVVGPGPVRGQVVYAPQGAIALSTPHPHDRTRTLALPLRPAWRGMILNTLLYAIAMLPMVMLLRFGWRQARTLRSRVRRGRGRCPACGYDLKGEHDAGCPECGWNRTVVPAKAGTQGGRR